jgi:hypothetical protein
MKKIFLWMVALSFVISFSAIPYANAQEKLFNIFGGGNKTEQPKTKKPIFLKNKNAAGSKTYISKKKKSSSNQNYKLNIPQLSENQTKNMTNTEIEQANLTLMMDGVLKHVNKLMDEAKENKKAWMEAQSAQNQQTVNQSLIPGSAQETGAAQKDPKNYVYQPKPKNNEPAKIWNSK